VYCYNACPGKWDVNRAIKQHMSQQKRSREMPTRSARTDTESTKDIKITTAAAARIVYTAQPRRHKAKKSCTGRERCPEV